MLLLLQGCSTSSGNGSENTDAKTPVEQTIPKDSAEGSGGRPGKMVVTLIPEQDPSGIYWGLRDTLSGKLAVDYVYENIGGFQDGFALVKQNGKYGLINKAGRVVITPEYDYPKQEINCGVIAFETGNGPVAIMDTTGKSVMPLVYGMTGFLPCQKRVTFGQDRYGMKSFSGDTILPFKFTNARVIPEGFCIASLTGKTGNNPLDGLYDLNGKLVLPHVFESIGDFSCGRSIVKKNGKYGVIDQTGKELFYTAYDRIDQFYNDYAMVYKTHNGSQTIGMINKNGHEVVGAIYPWLDHPTGFSEGLVAMAQNRKYGFVDTSGKVIVPFKYDQVESFRSGIAKVWVGGRYVNYVNKKGEEIIPPGFLAMDQANLRRCYSRYIIGFRDLALHVFDYSGKEITTLKYETIAEFNTKEKSFIVSMNNKWGTLDANFQVRIPVEYESLEPVFADKIAARKNYKTGLLSHEGKIILPIQYDAMEVKENGWAQVALRGKKGVINGYGKMIVAVNYDEIEDFFYGMAVVKRNNKYGFVNDKGKEVIPAIYDEAHSYNGYSAEVILKGETFQIDRAGNRVEEQD